MIVKRTTREIKCQSCNVVIGEQEIVEKTENGTKETIIWDEEIWAEPWDHDPGCPEFWKGFTSLEDIWRILESI